MLKKDTKIKWNTESKKSFDQVKLALTQSPVLINPDFTKAKACFSIIL
jgi:hypothetical protein